MPGVFGLAGTTPPAAGAAALFAEMATRMRHHAWYAESRHFDEAAGVLSRSAEGFDLVTPNPTAAHLCIAANSFLALAEYRRGHRAEALAALDRAHERAKYRLLNYGPGEIGTVQWCIAHIALRQAEALMSEPSPASVPATPASQAR